MFVISSIPEKYVGEIVVEKNGLRQTKIINEMLVNVPINLANVHFFSKGDIVQKELTRYYISFMFTNNRENWYYLNDNDRDVDYAKLTTLQSIGLFCNLGDID